MLPVAPQLRPQLHVLHVRHLDVLVWEAPQQQKEGACAHHRGAAGSAETGFEAARGPRPTASSAIKSKERRQQMRDPVPASVLPVLLWSCALHCALSRTRRDEPEEEEDNNSQQMSGLSRMRLRGDRAAAAAQHTRSARGSAAGQLARDYCLAAAKLPRYHYFWGGGA